MSSQVHYTWYTGKIMNMLSVASLFGGVPCDFCNVKYVPWLQKVGKHWSDHSVSISQDVS